MRPWPTAVRSFLTSMRSPCFGTGSRDMLIPMPSGMPGRSWAWRCSTATACTRRSRTAVASSSSRAESKSVARLPRSAPAPPDHDHSAPLQVEVVAPEWDATTDGERAGAGALVCHPPAVQTDLDLLHGLPEHSPGRAPSSWWRRSCKAPSPSRASCPRTARLRTSRPMPHVHLYTDPSRSP